MTTAVVMATAAPASASMVWGLALLNHHVLWLGLGLRLTSAANGRQLRLGADRVWDHLLLDQDGSEYMRFLRFLRQPIKLAQQLRQLAMFAAIRRASLRASLLVTASLPQKEPQAGCLLGVLTCCGHQLRLTGRAAGLSGGAARSA